MSNQFGLVQNSFRPLTVKPNGILNVVKESSDTLKHFSFERNDFFFLVFRKISDKLSTKQNKVYINQRYRGLRWCSGWERCQLSVVVNFWFSYNTFWFRFYGRPVYTFWCLVNSNLRIFSYLHVVLCFPDPRSQLGLSCETSETYVTLHLLTQRSKN